MNTTTSALPASISAVADALREAERTRIPVPPPTESVPGFNTDSAYAVQQANIARRVAAGERRVGHKIGLTSIAMQQQLGVDQPDYGVVLDSMVLPDDGTIDPTVLIAPRIEAEFAFRIGVDLPASPSRAELVAAIDGVAVALEIIDSRIAGWRIGLADTIADNASSARIVHGEPLPATPELLAALPGTTIVLTANGQQVAAGPGSAVLGDPITSLFWLSNAIGTRGDHFSRGDVILAGAVAAAQPLGVGVDWSASADGLPAVRVRSEEGTKR